MKVLRPYQQQAVKECWEALKKDDKPVLLMASVGAGKSLMLASILLTMQQSGKKALCLVNNAELVRNNCATLVDEGGKASIYCAALGQKDISESIIFGTPQSILNGITKNEPISEITFNLIVVDEAHSINYLSTDSVFMRILRYYKNAYPQMRVLGATGTDFRYKGANIVGEECLFRTRVGNITTEWLVKNNYLVKPVFEVDPNLVLDFSQVKIKKNGQFDQKQLESVIDKSARLTELICKQVVHIVETQNRFGVFLFATTKKHAYEILSHLPQGESALILGDTSQEDRTKILENSRAGAIKYLVNIAIISVGVDIPSFDTIAYLRPTESLVLLVQTMGRGLRLSEGKSDALVLDFAGNIERHRDWDNPVLLDAIKQTIDKDKPLVIQCPECQTLNTEHARRCVGVINDVRCEYYFEFKECVSCHALNDITARQCRKCSIEIIDPNAKLSLIKNEFIEVDVLKGSYGISGTQMGFRLHCAYEYQDNGGRTGHVYESYSPVSEKAIRFFYGNFVKKHCREASKWYPQLNKRSRVEKMLDEVDTPCKLLIDPRHSNPLIKKKYFNIVDGKHA